MTDTRMKGTFTQRELFTQTQPGHRGMVAGASHHSLCWTRCPRVERWLKLGTRNTRTVPRNSPSGSGAQECFACWDDMSGPHLRVLTTTSVKRALTSLYHEKQRDQFMLSLVPRLTGIHPLFAYSLTPRTNKGRQLLHFESALPVQTRP